MQDQQVEKQRENDETQRQIEEDTDREILELKNRYERQLRQEKEDNMKLKGDAGIMKKKVSVQKLYHMSRKLGIKFDGWQFFTQI